MRRHTEAEGAHVVNYFDIGTSRVSEAVGFVRKQEGVDGEPVGYVGLSLGGFVALSCAAQPRTSVVNACKQPNQIYSTL